MKESNFLISKTRISASHRTSASTGMQQPFGFGGIIKKPTNNNKSVNPTNTMVPPSKSHQSTNPITAKGHQTATTIAAGHQSLAAAHLCAELCRHASESSVPPQASTGVGRSRTDITRKDTMLLLLRL